MNILLTNDDGVHSEGLWALYRYFAKKHSVSVIAPDRERSAVSHAITLNSPLRVHKITRNDGAFGYAVNGTPADCIKLGIFELLDTRPDLVISGINPGENTGHSVYYSGTIAGAREAAFYGITAVAVSIQRSSTQHPLYYEDAAYFTASIIDQILEIRLPFGVFLNINFPDRQLQTIEGVKICRQETAIFSEYFDKRIDPRNGEYFWLGADMRKPVNPDTDCAALSQNYIAITPIRCDSTDNRMMETLRKLEMTSYELRSN